MTDKIIERAFYALGTLEGIVLGTRLDLKMPEGMQMIIDKSLKEIYDFLITGAAAIRCLNSRNSGVNMAYPLAGQSSNAQMESEIRRALNGEL